MKLHGLTLEVLNRAVSVYWGRAYGDSGTMPNFSEDGDPNSNTVLGLFQKNVVEAAGEQCTCYTIRLGNRNYPFMKLVFQEHLIAGEYFFAVDTHDEMEIKPDYPDYEAWMSVLRFNQTLKRDIELAFASEGLDTSACIRKMAIDRAGDDEPYRDLSILVVDDEEDLAETMAALLMARGFRVYKVHDGLTALSEARRLGPDLVLLDYELPEMDGLEVISSLRSDPGTAGIRILLATASQITLEEISQADGFLAKPFHEKLLYEVVERILGIREEADG